MRLRTILIAFTAAVLPLAVAGQGPQRGPASGGPPAQGRGGAPGAGFGAGGPGRGAAAPPCMPGEPYVCAQAAPEDLVVVPGEEWVVATVYTQQGGLRIINVKDKTSTVAFPSATAKESFDKKTYDTCPGPPDEAHKTSFQTHGVAIREGKNSVHTLYAVNHGKRESIEVFDLDAKTKPPTLTWVGCAVAPDPIGLNEVIPLPDGGFIGTDYLARGDNTLRQRMSAGEENGGLWEWHSGKGWKEIPNSRTSGANGLALSKDGKWLYVAAWGNQSFFKLSLGQTPPVRQDIKDLGFRPDNVRWAPDGKLFVTGQGGTGQTQTTNIVKIDPDTLKVTNVRTEPNNAAFGSGTVTVQLGKELWVGSYRGDRIAIYPAQ